MLTAIFAGLTRSVLISGGLLLLATGVGYSADPFDLDRTVPGQILVRFEDGTDLGTIATRLSTWGMEALGTDPLDSNRTRFLRLRVIDSNEVDLILPTLRRDPVVRWAEPNGLYRALAPNDPECLNDPDPEGNFFWDQWGYYRTQDDHAWDARPHASEMDLVRFAVLDTGLDFDHPDGPSDLCSGAGCIWTNALEWIGTPGVDDDGNGYTDDILGIDFVRSEQGTGEVTGYDGDPNIYASDPNGSCGDGLDNDGNGLRDELVYHGTHVASIALAQTNNGTMFAGHAWQAELMVVRVLSPEGWGTWADIAEGIEYAADNGAHVINLSLGGGFSQAVADACTYAHSLGCVIVAAAGNDGQGSLHYPARLAETIAVGASDPYDSRASFSNWGPEIDVVAPGVRIFANAVVSVWEGQGNNTVGDPTYYWANGTSQATPMVAALAANLRSMYGLDYDNEAVRCRIKDTARDLNGTWDGAGLIDAFAATTPVPSGSCCLDTSCIVSDEDCCISAGGIFLGNEPCDPGTCETSSVDSGALSREVSIVLTPNPSPGPIDISYRLDRDSEVRVRIFDAGGRDVAGSDLGLRLAGVHQAEWDGRDESGRELPTGRYFLQLETGSVSQTRSVQILR